MYNVSPIQRVSLRVIDTTHKYITCADCERQILGIHMLMSTDELPAAIYVAVERVEQDISASRLPTDFTVAGMSSTQIQGLIQQQQQQQEQS